MKKDTKHSPKTTISDVKLMLGYIWDGDKWLILLKFVAIIIGTCQTAIGTLYLKWIIDAISAGYKFDKVVGVILFVQGISLILYSMSVIVSKVIIPRREYKLRNYLQRNFIRKAMKQDLSCYEDASYYDNYTKSIRYADSKALDFMNLVFSAIKNFVNVLLLLSIIATLDPVVLLIVLIIVALSIFDQNKSSRYSHEEYEAEESINRRSEYIKRVSHYKGFAKEVRLFNLGPFLLEKLNQTFLDKYEIYKKTNKKYWRFKYIIHVINSLLIVPFLLGYITLQTIKGVVTLGGFTVLFSTCFQIADDLSSIVISFDKLNFESEFYVSHLKKLFQYNSTIESSTNGEKDIDSINSIVFKDVSFHYPHHTQEILNNISFEVKNGEKIAIVGRNGAGKSTIIKLLVRLYDVSSGEILINGVNIKEYNILALRKCFSTVMQDFNIYSFSVKDNISMGETYKNNELHDAIEFGDISDKINSLDGGIDTNIGREFFEDGIELSGGERQKIAISRAYIRHSSVMVFDEANSALDPFAEYELNKKISQIMSDQITFFVSHRLTTTANSDRIILIEKGKIVECGTHEELYLNSDGLYHAMFDKQAKAYVAGKDAERYE